ncbi:MAG: hypothetical protein JWR12_928 [Mucilaginibacter sp.]|nr:hypothetical protein [Mucilaginibacter sp.]
MNGVYWLAKSICKIEKKLKPNRKKMAFGVGLS